MTGDTTMINDTYYLVKLPAGFSLKRQWPGIIASGMVVRVTTNKDGSESGNVRRPTRDAG